MKHSLRTGLSFGLTSGVITTLGLMIGLYAGTNSRLAVIGGIVTIAVADAFSDALGIHISEESKADSTQTHIWEATIATWLAKFIFALTFLVPVLVLPLFTAVVVAVAWGAGLVVALSVLIARSRQESAWRVVGEHLLITGLVIAVTRLLGGWIARVF